MENNIKIKLKGHQYNIGEDENIQTIAYGKWYQKNGKEYIIYDDNMLVENGTVHTTIKIESKKITMIRTGKIENTMIFEKGKKQYIPYQTPYGIFDMIAETKTLEWTKDEQTLQLFISYVINLNKMDMGLHAIEVEIEKLETCKK